MSSAHVHPTPLPLDSDVDIFGENGVKERPVHEFNLYNSRMRIHAETTLHGATTYRLQQYYPVMRRWLDADLGVYSSNSLMQYLGKEIDRLKHPLG